MNEHEFRIVGLIERYLKDELSGAERQELESWKHQAPGNLRIFEHLTNGNYLKGSIGESYTDERKENLLVNIHNRIEADRGSEVKQAPLRSITVRRLMSAAAIIAFVAGVAYFWLHDSKPEQVAQTTTQATQDDKTAGSNGAVLKLANGKEIVLDNMADGNLAQEGNASIKKEEGNILVYNNKDGKSGEVLFNTLTTPVGRQFQIVLPDRTKVWLNSASSITYPTTFSGNERNVTVSGEVYMEVAKDAAKPFKAHVSSAVNGMEETVVQVLGTHFNINAYADETPVVATLLEGSVRVMTGKSTALLKPGQQAQVGTQKIDVRSGVDTDKETAWKSGYFQFDDDPLQTVMRELSRWYGVTVVYSSSFKVPDDTFNGRIPRSSSLTDVLSVLEKNQLHFKVEGKKIIVSP